MSQNVRRAAARNATLGSSSMGFQAPAPIQEVREQQQPPQLWNVVLLNDDDHTYDYVIEMLMRLFLKTADEAYRNAVEVDSTGRTIVMT